MSREKRSQQANERRRKRNAKRRKIFMTAVMAQTAVGLVAPNLTVFGEFLTSPANAVPPETPPGTYFLGQWIAGTDYYAQDPNHPPFADAVFSNGRM